MAGVPKVNTAGKGVPGPKGGLEALVKITRGTQFMALVWTSPGLQD